MSLPDDPRKVYVTADPEEDEPRAYKHRLVANVKEIIEHVALLDIHGTPVDELQGLIDDASALAARLASLPSLREVGGMASADLSDAALMERSGISGRSNPLAPPLHL